MNTSVATQQKTWQLDLMHSRIEFQVSHMVIANISGFFKNFSGRVVSEGDNFENANVEISIDAASIDTNNEQRDAHLLSEEFLDVANHPGIFFKSNAINKTSENTYRVRGDFSLRGVTKEIMLEVKHNGTVVDPYGNQRAGFEVKAEINRKEYGVNWHAVLDNGGLVAGDIVKINASIEVVQQ